MADLSKAGVSSGRSTRRCRLWPRRLKCWEDKRNAAERRRKHQPSRKPVSRTCSSDEEGNALSGPDGIWNDQSGCYMRLADQQPPLRVGSRARWYQCTWLPGAVSGANELYVWLDQPPGVDPAQLARQLLATIQLARIESGSRRNRGRRGCCGLPTYLWVQNPGSKTLGPITDSASAGGIMVTLTGKVDHVVWDTGDGTTVTCTGPGTPYQDSFGAAPSPTCGHLYKHRAPASPAAPTRSGSPRSGTSPGREAARTASSPSRSRQQDRCASARCRRSTERRWNGPSTLLRQVRTTRRDEVGASSCSVVRAQMQPQGQRPPPLEPCRTDPWRAVPSGPLHDRFTVHDRSREAGKKATNQA